MKESTITGKTLQHMQHAEDLLLHGSAATSFALKGLYDLYDVFTGNTDADSVAVKLKSDGAPSVIASSSFRSKAFVATKGFFAKDRKIAYTEQDCDRYFGHAPDLASKMKKLLKYLPQIGIPENEVWQGDFLFDNQSLSIDNIDGEDCVVFHPNAIVYAVPLSDPLSDKIRQSEIGVAWHTRYTGPDFDRLNISFDVSKDELQDIPQVFSMDATIPSVAGRLTLTEEESVEVEELLKTITSNVEQLTASGFIDVVAAQEEMQFLLLTFENFLIKTQGVQFTSNYFKSLIRWIEDRFDKEIAKKKQQKTKDAYEAKKKDIVDSFYNYQEEVELLVETQKAIADLKTLYIEKLDSIQNLKTYFKTIDKGYINTGHEGYAISDIEGNVQKLVSRLEFSKGNFSKDILKGWMSDKRMNEKMNKAEVQTFLKDIFGDRIDFKGIPKSSTGGTIQVIDKEDKRELAAEETAKQAKENPSVEEVRVARQGKDVIIDDWVLKFKNLKHSSGNQGHVFEDELTPALAQKDVSNPVVAKIAAILGKDYNLSIEDVVEAEKVGGKNVPKSLHKASLERGKLLVLPPALIKSGDISGGAIGEALADILVTFSSGEVVPLSLKTNKKISLINSGLVWGKRNAPMTERFHTIQLISRALSDDIDSDRAIKGFLDYQQAFDAGTSKSIRKPLVTEPVTLKSDVWAAFITSAMGWGYIMVHDDHITNITEELVTKIASEPVKAFVAYPHSGKGRFEIRIDSSYLKSAMIVIRDTSASGIPDKLLIEYGGFNKGI